MKETDSLSVLVSLGLLFAFMKKQKQQKKILLFLFNNCHVAFLFNHKPFPKECFSLITRHFHFFLYHAGDLGFDFEWQKNKWNEIQNRIFPFDSLHVLWHVIRCSLNEQRITHLVLIHNPNAKPPFFGGVPPRHQVVGDQLSFA